MRHALAVVVVLLVAVGSLSAAVFEPVSDAQLVARAELIVVADVVATSSRRIADGRIVTDARLSVRDVLKGTAGAEVVVTEFGGVVGDVGMMVTGSASYRAGDRVVAFLEEGGGGAWRTSSMALGLFVRDTLSGGDEVFVRDGHTVETTDADAFTPRNAAEFAEFVRTIARGTAATADSAPFASSSSRTAGPFVPKTEGVAASSYALELSGMPVRYPFTLSGGTVSYLLNEAGGITGANTGLSAERALDVWTNHEPSSITLEVGGFTAVNNIGPSDGLDTIVFGETPPNGIGTCTSTAVACGIYWVAGTHTFDGTSFRSITEGDIVVRDGSYSQATLDSLVAHEIGHTIGLRHSNEGTPGTTNALMNSTVPQSGATLRQWDMDAMAEMYGPGIPCDPIDSVSISGGGSVTAGQTKTLTANNSGGNGTFTYQWYQGNAGDTSQPVGTNSKTFVTPPVNEQMSFWVKVSNACTAGVSSAAVTVQPSVPPTCNAVAITTQPGSPTIASGGTATLTVGATGTAPRNFQWFEGAVGNTSKPVGTNSATFVTPPLTATTQYWVRVSNTCGQGSTANSIQATVTVAASCIPPTIAAITGNHAIGVGSSTTLTVAANGTAPIAFQWFNGDTGNISNPIVGATGPSLNVGPFTTPGVRKFWVRVTGCTQQHVNSGTISVDVTCGAAATPVIQIPPIVNSERDDFKVRWEAPSGITGFTFEVQRSTSPSFTAPVSTTVDGVDELVVATAGLAPNVRHYMRVRAISKCNQASSVFSPAGNFVFVVNTKPDIGPNGGVLPSLSGPHDSNEPVTQKFRLIPSPTAVGIETFVITTDQPWLTASPSSGAITPPGVDITLTINPAELPIGSSSANVTVVRTDGASAGGVTTHGSSSTSLPLSFGKVTPVSPLPRDGNVTAATLIIPAVAHADGLGARFQSDVRLANTSSETITYELNFTPSASTGLLTGKKTTVDVAPRTTFALDDIVQVWFGAGIAGEVGSGTLEIRPLSTAGGGTPPIGATVASSRLFAIGPAGTLGQFIPALPQSKFITNSAADPLAKISLQQIAQSAAFRTNLGFVEGSGAAVSFLVKALDKNNNVVAQKTMSLGPFEHQQHPFAAVFPNVVLSDGRVEVTTTTPAGKATAYASVLDNKTTDPLMVFPEQAGRLSANRYVVPGVAELNAGSNFHTDMRIFNAASTPVSVTLHYVPQFGDATPRPPSKTFTINANETSALDNILPTLWSLNGTGGSVVITTPNASSLVATARTYSRDAAGGTYGQFIPGVTQNDAVGLGERSLHVLQLEDSIQFRSNLGLFEVSGAPAKVEVTAHTPDDKFHPVFTIDLGAHGFIQLPRVLSSMGLPSGYNGRVSVKVVEGTGRISAYGSVVDNRTLDPTYVPAQ